MPINQNGFNARLRSEISEFVCRGREKSAAFLIWYLHNFFRIDKQEAIDSVCDTPNDKGIDGIYVDDDEEDIFLFQAKFSPYDNRHHGDNDLKKFVGAREWFGNEQSMDSLFKSRASHELKSLVKRFGLTEKISLKFSVHLHFITNKAFDRNAKDFLKLAKDKLEGYDIRDLLNKYTYIADQEIQTTPKTLHLANSSNIKYDLPNGIIVRVYPIQAKELLKLDGIQNRTLFYKNVRYGLGRTRVNKDIEKTILDATEHDNFFLYHNGITIICDTLDETGRDQIKIQNYSVINGCQSMLSFYENREQVTDNIYLLTKFIKLESASPLVQQITYFTNNQNAITLKDLKSRDRTQRALKREFNELFNNRVLYRIKRGESGTDYDQIIDIDFAAQLIEAFFLGGPHNTHLKSRLFGERYSKIFSRHITAAKIYLANLVYKIIEDNVSKLKNEQVRGYGLAKFFFTYVIGEILKTDEIGIKIIDTPCEYITIYLDQLRLSIKKLWDLLTPDINAYVEEFTEKNSGFFDYKNVFKSSAFVQNTSRRIKTDHQRILVRHPEDSFKNIFQSF